ncbi:MAG: hypothetical protein RBT36_11805 [Desulfobulbus sp.]|jgi:hypothetical protein|nr:hypothetical protein [Desulfobulbus sp.]
MGGEENSLTEEQADIQSDKLHSDDWVITADLCALLIKKRDCPPTRVRKSNKQGLSTGVKQR